MNEKNSKNGIFATIIITLVVLALLNVCTFIIPFNKVDLIVHFTAYGCAEFVILAEMTLILTQLFSGAELNQKIVSLPIVLYGYIVVVIQVVTTAVFYLINAYIELPIWIVIIVESLIIGFGIIRTAKGFFFKAKSVDYHESFANTKFMDEFRARLRALYKINNNKNIEKVLEDLLETALSSDPVTNDKTIDSESELLSLLQELDEAIKDGSEEESRNVIEKTRNALLERNVLCKTGK